MSHTRPVVSVFETPSSKTTATMPPVFMSPLRPDLVCFCHQNMMKNKRQAYGVKAEAGYDTAAESWGTGRAVARVPRVPGGGTHRAGQAAFGNMCRGGGMFAPTKTWRRWHRKINVTQKRHAMASAIASTAIPALVMARGHRINEVPELPLVVSDSAQAIKKTKDAVALLESYGMAEELSKVRDSKKIRAGKGKWRGRKYTLRRGPLVVYDECDGVSKAMRNIPGVETLDVNSLNLLSMAPGGNLGRLTIWTESAFKKLNKIFGNYRSGSSMKKGYMLPRPLMQNSDVARIINSAEVQSVLRPAIEQKAKYANKKNPLKNKTMLEKMVPGAIKLKIQRKREHEEGTKENEIAKKRKTMRMAKGVAHNKAGKKLAFYNQVSTAYDIKPEPEAEEVDEE